nr:TPA_inf: Toll-like receptor 15 [Neoceratodus forsteri]
MERFFLQDYRAYGNFYFNYSYLNLKSIPKMYIPKSAKALNFSHNVIHKISKTDFARLDALEAIDLSYNQIEIIEVGAFEDLFNLTFLDLSLNKQLTTIPELAPSLKALQIHGTPVYSIQYSNLNQLQYISLEVDNYLSLAHLVNLEVLHLHIGTQSPLHFSADNVRHLRSLTISLHYDPEEEETVIPNTLRVFQLFGETQLDNVHLEGIFHWMDILRLLGLFQGSFTSNIKISGMVRLLTSCKCYTCGFQERHFSNNRRIPNQNITLQLRQGQEIQFDKEASLLSSFFLLHLQRYFELNKDIVSYYANVTFLRKFIDVCTSPVDGILDLSNITFYDTPLLVDALNIAKCKLHCNKVLVLNISHNNLKIDLLSLLSVVNMMDNLQYIDASFNRLYVSTGNIDSKCYFSSNNLLFLNISHNPINSLYNICVPATLKILDLSYTNLTGIPESFASNLPNLETIYLQGNTFIFQDRKCFDNSDIYCPKDTCFKSENDDSIFHVSAISLASSETTPIKSIPNTTKYLEIANCSIVQLPDWLAAKTRDLQFVCLRNNYMSDIPCFSPSVDHLDVSYNQIKSLPVCLQKLSNLKVLKIQHNNLFILASETLPSTLIDFDISGNNLEALPLNLSRTLPLLQYFNVSGNAVTELHPSNLPLRLECLDLSHNLLSVLPDGLGKHMTELKYFNLSWNKISFLQTGSLSLSLVVLDVSYNAITTITQETFGVLIDLKDLVVTGNSFFCNCDLYWLVNEYISRPHLVVHGWDSLLCFFPQEKRETLVKDYNPMIVYCNLGIQLAITASAATFVMLLITVLCWRYDGPWYIRMGWYWCMAKRTQYEKKTEDKLYDAFLSYSETDASWIKQELLKKLEGNGLRICYHERDFKPGHPVLGNIFYSIENSHKVIFILSSGFVNSCWCQYELYFAEHRVLNENEDSLIMIVLEELPPNCVPQKFIKLRKLLKRKTYLKWSSEETKQAIFWHQLITVLKTFNDPVVKRAYLKSEESINT